MVALMTRAIATQWTGAGTGNRDGLRLPDRYFGPRWLPHVYSIERYQQLAFQAAHASCN